jgi:hypothetical protein
MAWLHENALAAGASRWNGVIQAMAADVSLPSGFPKIPGVQPKRKTRRLKLSDGEHRRDRTAGAPKSLTRDLGLDRRRQQAASG